MPSVRYVRRQAAWHGDVRLPARRLRQMQPEHSGGRAGDQADHPPLRRRFDRIRGMKEENGGYCFNPGT